MIFRRRTALLLGLLIGLTLMSPIGAVTGQTVVLTGRVPLRVWEVMASAITSSEATISWTTNGPATSRLFYDEIPHPDAGEYRHSTALDPALVSRHVVAISRLHARTVYHFRVGSTADNWTVLSDDFTFVTDPAGGEGGGGGSGGGVGVPQGPGTVNLAPYTNEEGMFNIPAVFKSADGMVEVAIGRGVCGLTSQGRPLRFISIRESNQPPSAPEHTQIIGSVYELAPDAATLTPAGIITVRYDPGAIPQGSGEARLLLAAWEGVSGTWTELPTTVDPALHLISSPLEFFSAFAVVAPTRPAAFAVSDVLASPSDAGLGETVRISAVIANNGDLQGSYLATLKLNGLIEAASAVEVAGGGTRTVVWTITRNDPGVYAIDVGGATGLLTVTGGKIASAYTFTASDLNVVPAGVYEGGRVGVSAVVANRSGGTISYPVRLVIDARTWASEHVTLRAGTSATVVFEVTDLTAGIHLVEIEGLSAVVEVAPPPGRPAMRRGPNWWLVGAALSASAAAVCFICLRARRLRA